MCVDRVHNMLEKIVNKPMKIFQIYLWSTFGLFTISSFSLSLENPFLLFLIVGAGNVALFWGYKVAVNKRKNILCELSFDSGSPSKKTINVIILISTLYFFTYSFAHFYEYGFSLSWESLSIILDPGHAYMNKFLIYEQFEEEHRVSLCIQVLVLFGAVYAALIPILVVFWEKIYNSIRCLAISSIFCYELFFLSIGTMKGLGDLLIFFFSAWLVRNGNRQVGNISKPLKKTKNKSSRVILLVGLCAFVFYMPHAMQSRLDTSSKSLDTKGPLENIVDYLFTKNSDGINVALSYPIHGYSGLDKNLTPSFEWTYGLGSLLALNSYKNQYIGGVDYYKRTYPARTEELTGYPALQNWSTIYPWLASDLTYFGAIVFMYILGWFIGNLWIESFFYMRPLSIILFCQTVIMVFFNPANNQIFISRLTFLGFFSLLILYICTNRGRRRIVFYAKNP